MAKKKKVGCKPGIRTPVVEEVEGDEEIAEIQVTETTADGLNLIVEMVVHDSITEPKAITSRENQAETLDFNSGSHGKSWGEETESEQERLRETVWNSTKKNWESFTRDKNITRDQKLLYTEPQIRDGIKIAQVDLEEVQEQEENWKLAIVCKVLAANPLGHDLDEQKEELAVYGEEQPKGMGLNKFGVCGLLETKINDDRIKDMINRKFSNWGYYTSPTIENRILIMWRKNYARVIVIKEDPQSVYCYVKMSGQSKAMCITFVYGYNTAEERKSLWADLMGVQIPAASWLVTGDFNALFEIDDRKGGNLVTLGDVEDATNWLGKSHLVPLIKTGSRFTWTNNQEGNKRIYSKIDHSFVNEEWVDNFPLTKAHYGWEVVSDHCVCIISMRVDENIGRKPFRYYNFWADHQEFKKVVMEDWSRLVQAVGLKSLFLKLMHLKHKLKKFNKEVIGDIGKNYQEAKDRYM
uniref:Endonuclease/exonuclease/phosphatase domain-containing protein n=1 Tax=Cannabis sativa TaxID=3483 RepID=A0A803Q0X6_CANSA